MTFQHKEEHVDAEMILLQANIDNMNHEFCSFVMDQLFEAGANDVYWLPIMMKKNRPGIMLNVLLDEELLPQVEEIIFRETTTLGLRYMQASCHRLGRESIAVDTEWGAIQVKLGYYGGKLVQFAPEFDDCERAAREHSVPLKAVYDEVRRVYLNLQI